MPPVWGYMSHYVAANNNPFGGDYKAALAPYLIDVWETTNAPGPADVA